MRRSACCQPVGKGCGDLYYSPACAACKVAADLVRLADLRGSITFHPDPSVSAPYFWRQHGKLRIGHPDLELCGELAAELVGVDRLPLQDVVNELLRIPMNLLRGLVVWSHGEPVSLRRLLSPGPRLVT